VFIVKADCRYTLSRLCTSPEVVEVNYLASKHGGSGRYVIRQFAPDLFYTVDRDHLINPICFITGVRSLSSQTAQDKPHLLITRTSFPLLNAWETSAESMLST